MKHVDYCVNCDKKMTAKESENITTEMRKYFYILCTRCLKAHKADVQRVINNPEGENNGNR